MKHGDTFAARLYEIRKIWGLTQDELADRAGVGIATIRRMEGGKFDPRLSTATKLADALQVRVEWLLTGDNGMVGLRHMTRDEQEREQTGPGTEGLPGYVIVPGGVWYRDKNGQWHVDSDNRVGEGTHGDTAQQ